MQINNISAVDIFLDCREDLIAKFNQYFFNPDDYHFVNRNKIILREEEDTNVFCFSKLRRNGAESKTYYVGKAKTTGKQVCIYNKTEELGKSQKVYIADLHRQYLSGDGDVFRFELRLVNKYIRIRGYQVDFEKLYDIDYVKELFRLNLDRFVDFRKTDDAKITRCSKVPLFDLTKTSNAVVLRTGNNDSHKSISKAKQRKQRQTLKELIDDAISNKSQKELSFCYDKAKQYNLLDYYHSLTKGVDLNKRSSGKIEKNTGFDFDNWF